jgi:hypothetical protein
MAPDLSLGQVPLRPWCTFAQAITGWRGAFVFDTG